MGCGGSKENASAKPFTGLIIPCPHASLLPQNVTDKEQLQQRHAVIVKNKADYEIEFSDWLPPFCKVTPEHELDSKRTLQFLNMFLFLDARRVEDEVA